MENEGESTFMSLSQHALEAAKSVEYVAGDCEEHGFFDRVLVRKGDGFKCPKCTAAQAKAEMESKWLADRQATLLAIARIPGKYAGQKFQATTPAMAAVRTMVRNFRDFMVQENRWAVLVLMGSMGTGKTLLACEFAESLIRKLSRSVRYVTAQGIVSEIQASYGTEGKSEEGEIEKFVQYDLLIIDEIDAKRTSDNANMLINEVINRRYNAERPVVIITNQPFDNLAQFVGDRVDDRLHENAFVCSFNWPSFRRQ